MSFSEKSDQVIARSIVESAIPLKAGPSVKKEKTVATVRIEKIRCVIWARIYKLSD